MRKFNLLFITIVSFWAFTFTVEAGSFSLVPSSVNVSPGAAYKVNVKYNGETLGSATFNLTFHNANCSGSGSSSSIIGNCGGSSCEVSLGYNPSGYVSGSTLYTLNCTSTSGTANFMASIHNGDAWDVNGEVNIAVSSASTSIRVIAPTTTTTVPPTVPPTTSRQVVTTTPTTPKTQVSTKTTTTNIPTTSLVSQEEVTQNLEETTTNVMNEETSTTITTTKNTQIPDDLKLKELKIVGYDFNFKSNMTGYTINVAKDVTELYVIATPIDENTQISNVGIIDIRERNYFVIKVYNDFSKNAIEYKININRGEEEENSSFDIYIVVMVLFVIIAISAVILTMFKKGRDNLEKIDNVVIEPVLPSNEVGSNNLYGEIIDEGIIDIPENEDELTKVFDDLNNQ